ncbi:transporter substrate-binding domain-containing protein [Bifidobacterium ramosum]|uniref:transporter substrate-binding domain-containing protein n=1 Tax=Bifidobacterium ramosum TaxID=1798158 RepID=UPI0013CFD905|nr:transporter substrate-binding domain-containing protein [Bifidobacterium ramosum]
MSGRPLPSFHALPLPLPGDGAVAADVAAAAAWARRRMRARVRVRRMAAAVCALILAAVPLAGCGAASESTATDGAGVVSATSGQPQGPTVTIGVTSDLPGLGYWHDGTYSGFDVDVATAVAKALGYGRKQIVFVQVRPQDRATVLDDGRADMVIAGFAMTDDAARRVAFAGPYLDVRPAVLTHDDTSLDERTVAGLFIAADQASDDDRTSDDALDTTAADGDTEPDRNLTVCAVNGTAVRTMIAGHDDVTVMTFDTYGQCMTALMAGSVDAVAGDNATLPGLMRDRRGSYRIVTDPSDDHGLQYGIAVRHDRTTLAQRVDDALRTMIDNGSWQRYVDADLAPFGYRATQPPTIPTDSDR